MPTERAGTTLLLAPDSFKGSFTAEQVADAMAAGCAPRSPIDRCPVADGGEGTARVLLDALGGELVSHPATGPGGEAVDGEFALLSGGEVAVVETASASGWKAADASPHDAWSASTEGTGELIVAAVRAGARTVLLAAGGSATSDGGAGALAAIARAGGLAGARVRVLTDVETSFEHAARDFGPQKGAFPDQVVALTRRLHEQAAQLPRDPRGVLGSGAAGGLAGGLWAALGAEIVPGASYVLDAIFFPRRLAEATAVLVGEGRLDQQSLRGKITGEVACRARAAAVPCYAIVGSRELADKPAREAGFADVFVATTLGAIRDVVSRLDVWA